jgi:hypothetical protein
VSQVWETGFFLSENSRFFSEYLSRFWGNANDANQYKSTRKFWNADDADDADEHGSSLRGRQPEAIQASLRAQRSNPDSNTLDCFAAGGSQ